MNEDVIRPLDDLIAKHGGDLKKNQLISVNGKIMAVAFMANAQHLVYRADILAAAGIEAPTTYEEMLAGAKVIRDKACWKTRLAALTRPGGTWRRNSTTCISGMAANSLSPARPKYRSTTPRAWPRWK